MNAIESNNRLDSLLNKHFVTPALAGFVEVGKEKFCYPNTYEDFEEKIRTFEVRNDDVWLCAFPKTGSTWVNEMLWMLVNDLNYEEAKQTLQARSPLFEFSALINRTIAKDLYPVDSMTFVDGLKSPRCLKTHLAFPLLPEQIRNGTKKPKIIVPVRNPQDVCISLYNFTSALERYNGTYEDFCELFLGGRVPYGPFWDQVLSYWQNRHNLNVLFVYYKEMKKDLPAVIRQVADFLGKTVTDDQVEKLTEHLSFNNMKNNPAVNYQHVFKQYTLTDKQATHGALVRVGKEGGYKTIMTPEMIAKFEAKTKEKTQGTGLEF